MKHINEHYEDWCGENRNFNDCRPVHDSSEAIEFAEYYHKEMIKESLGKISVSSMKELLTVAMKKQHFATAEKVFDLYTECNGLDWETMQILEQPDIL